MTSQNNSNINNKQQLQKYIEILVEQNEEQLLQEAMSDTIKNIWTKTKGVVTDKWNAIKENFSGVSNKVLSLFTNTLTAIKNSFSVIQTEYKAVIDAASAAGTPIKISGPIKEAVDLSKKAKTVAQQIIADSKQTEKLGQQTAQQQTQQEAIRFQKYNALLTETALQADKLSKPNNKTLTEAATVPTVLATFGGIKLSLKFLSKFFGLFNLTQAQTISTKLHDGYHKMHVAEEAILGLIPDKAAYVFYSNASKLRKKQPLAYENFVKSPSAMKTKKYMYTVVLTYFLVTGIYHMVHAGWQAVHATHVGVDGTHAVEVGEAVIDVAKSASAEGGIASTAAAEMADMGDIIETEEEVVSNLV